ncbi:V-type proton ATPase subunit G1-like [Carica papaya]|uniref:V-type proton ATPase subunit G1-like n=1 Tax=Carica papaya TaxID=3649 RepID=UPI000B8CB1A2|nr:V-type proton ATPase subunit G1-like [Carica papaya]
MESIKGHGGIQMLLTAEQEAQHIVSTARQSKMTRLKQAKDEAEREVMLCGSHMEEEYHKKVTEITGNSGCTSKQLEEETEAKIKKLKESSSSISKDVIDMLIKTIVKI